MSAPRFFVDGPVRMGAQVDLHPEDIRHALLALRLRRGSEVIVVANKEAWHGQLTSITKRAAQVNITAQSSEPSPELPQPVTILQAIPKGNKMDYIVEKTIELGAARIVPIQSARSCAQVSENKLQRWRNIARAAAQQARRLIIPEIDTPINWEHALHRFGSREHLVVAHESAQRGTLAQALDKNDRELALAVGPEGSFTQEELDQARDSGADFVSLGPTTLRTETAALALLAAVACIKRWW